MEYLGRPLFAKADHEFILILGYFADFLVFLFTVVGFIVIGLFCFFLPVPVLEYFFAVFQQ